MLDTEGVALEDGDEEGDALTEEDDVPVREAGTLGDAVLDLVGAAVFVLDSVLADLVALRVVVAVDVEERVEEGEGVPVRVVDEEGVDDEVEAEVAEGDAVCDGATPCKLAT